MAISHTPWKKEELLPCQNFTFYLSILLLFLQYREVN